MHVMRGVSDIDVALILKSYAKISGRLPHEYAVMDRRHFVQGILKATQFLEPDHGINLVIGGRLTDGGRSLVLARMQAELD